MNKKPATAALLLTSVYAATVFSGTAQAYMSDKARLDKAAADCSAGRYKEGEAEFHALADEGCPFAQCILGVMYQNGRGVPKNVHTAIGWYSKSAKQGYSVAEEHLGEIYQYGEQGIKVDNKQAADWYRRAAFHGNGKAQLALFKLFISGKNSNQPIEARYWLAKACQLPGEWSDEAHKAFANLPPMKEVTRVQDAFGNELAAVAVAGTGKVPPPSEPVSTSKPLQIGPPIGMPGTLADHWDGIVQMEHTLSADTKKEMDKFSGH